MSEIQTPAFVLFSIKEKNILKMNRDDKKQCTKFKKQGKKKMVDLLSSLHQAKELLLLDIILDYSAK